MTIVPELQLLKKFDIVENMKKLNELRGWERVCLFSIVLFLIYILILFFWKNIAMFAFQLLIALAHVKNIGQLLLVIGYIVLFLIAILSVPLLVLIGIIWVIEGSG